MARRRTATPDAKAGRQDFTPWSHEMSLAIFGEDTTHVIREIRAMDCEGFACSMCCPFAHGYPLNSFSLKGAASPKIHPGLADLTSTPNHSACPVCAFDMYLASGALAAHCCHHEYTLASGNLRKKT